MFAIIETGGKQIMVGKDQSIFVEKLEGEKGSKIVFDKVLVLDDKIGKPYISNAKVEGVIEKQGLQKKVVIYRTKRKSNWKTKKGHRQAYTRVKIETIIG